MKITVVIDRPAKAPFIEEFGLSLFLEYGKKEFLFDTGAGSALPCNLRLCGILPVSIRDVILSHGHSDHTGGLALLQPQSIRCCKGICDGHFSRHEDGEIHCITMPERSQENCRSSSLIEIKAFEEIEKGLWLTGPIPRNSGEDCGGDFYHDPECKIKDTVPEEQALLTQTGVLVTGCCHAGIINTIRHCHRCHPEIRIRKIIGGLHLVHAKPERLEQTALFLRESKIEEMYLLHCTGAAAVDYLKAALPCCKIFTPEPGESFTV